jgi:gamma-glutamylcyclotransferase (GGCT)/AIG2-like uncharacterized protein YtfP
MATDVFVYGTLTEPTQVSTVLDEYEFGPQVVCYGLKRVDGQYPTLVPGDTVSGRLLYTPELDRLDSYEGVDRGLYCRVSVPLVDPRDQIETSVDVYVGNPIKLGVSETAQWPGSGPFEQQVSEYIETNHVSLKVKTETDDF